MLCLNAMPFDNNIYFVCKHYSPVHTNSRILIYKRVAIGCRHFYSKVKMRVSNDNLRMFKSIDGFLYWPNFQKKRCYICDGGVCVCANNLLLGNVFQHEKIRPRAPQILELKGVSSNSLPKHPREMSYLHVRFIIAVDDAVTAYFPRYMRDGDDHLEIPLLICRPFVPV